MNKVAHESKICENYKIYNKIKRIIAQENDPLEKIKLIQSAAEFACINFTGYFSDVELENFALEYAVHPNLRHDDYEKKSILHVFTECYPVGGHTRLAYWAIKSLHDRKHYVILINQRTAIPEWLKAVLQDRLIILNAKDDFLQKAKELKQISFDKEIIILYTHMNDPVPLLAYGTPSFPRPILYYNHADHLFWLGVSISDCVLDLSLYGQELSRKSRGVVQSEICPVPIEIPSQQIPKDQAKLKLGIPLEKYVILSTGSAYKFETVDYSLIDFAMQHYDRDDFMFIFIGPSATSNAKWCHAEKVSNGNVKALGIVKDLAKFDLYLDAADLYINSYPIGSLTAVLQAAMRDNLPVLNIKNHAAYDIFRNSYVLVDDIAELHNRIVEIRNNKYKHEISEIQKKVISCHGVPSWSIRLAELTDKYSHQAHHINNEFTPEYGANLPRAYAAQILLSSKPITNMGVHIRSLKLSNRMKMFLILFNLKTFIFDIPRLFKAVKRIICVRP